MILQMVISAADIRLMKKKKNKLDYLTIFVAVKYLCFAVSSLETVV